MDGYVKILIIMGGFSPGGKYGGPPVSVNNFCSLMDKDHCFIVTHNHDMDENQPYPDIKSECWIEKNNCKIMYLPNEKYNINEFRKIIIEINPDIIYLQGLFQQCILPCLRLSKELKIKVLLAPRRELCRGAFRKKLKKIPYILILKIFGLLKYTSFQSTSVEETFAIKKYLSIEDTRVFFLKNVPSIPERKYERMQKIRGKARFIFLSRVHPKKNLISAIRYLSNVEGDVEFDIYGPLQDKNYWQDCQKAIDMLPSNVRVNYHGLISHDEVHEIFSQYDAFIFPTFSENYGHVIAESLIVGTPVILGKGTTPWDDINDRAGLVAELTNAAAFSQYLNQIVGMDSDTYNKMTEVVFQYIDNKLKLDQLKEDYSLSLNQILKNEV